MARARLEPADVVKRSGGEISHARLNNWLKGYNDPSKEVLPKLAAIARTSVAELLGDTIRETRPVYGGARPRRTRGIDEIDIPKIQAVRAGDWSDPFDSDETAPVPAFLVSPMSFCTFVDGDSMYEFLHPHDLAIFESHRSPRIGLVILARNQNGEMTIKQLRHSGTEYILHALNPAYEDQEAESWRIEGYLTGFIRDDGEDRLIRANAGGLRP